MGSRLRIWSRVDSRGGPQDVPAGDGPAAQLLLQREAPEEVDVRFDSLVEGVDARHADEGLEPVAARQLDGE
eukprot:8850012-Lingulodinium_polyedra.AAC.1